MGTLPIAALLTIALSQDGQPAPQTSTSWLVAYEESGSDMTRLLMGTLEMAGDVLRYRSITRGVMWEVKLEDATTRVESVQSPVRQVYAIVIESTEDGKVVRRRIAPVNSDWTLAPPGTLARTISIKVIERRSEKAPNESR